ncbi:MAG: hypothetical protein NUV40_04415 [Patescibacteria group bacterium]|nr:hypothetical protein [Patescibacteria group bacterium]
MKREKKGWIFRWGVLGECCSFYYTRKGKTIEVQFFVEKGKMVFRRFPV